MGSVPDPQDAAGKGAIRSRLVLPEWLEAGLLGAFAVIAVFFLLDGAAGDPLRTPAVLGTLLFQGLEAGGTAIVPGAAAAYHFIHFGAWVAVGLVGTQLVRRAEDRPQLRWVPLAGLGLFLLTLLLADVALEGTALGRGHLWFGGLAGIAAVGGFLLWRHPQALKGSGARRD